MDKLNILNESRMARVGYSSAKPYIDALRKDLLARLLAQTKVGPIDPQIYAKFLGGISAIDELEALLKREVLKGEKIEKELLDASQRNPNGGGPDEIA